MRSKPSKPGETERGRKAERRDDGRAASAAPAARAKEQADEDEFYTTYGIIPKPKGTPLTLTEKLFARPPRIPADHVHVPVAGAVQQADLLQLPDDAGHVYALVAVDLATRACDAEPIKGKSAASVLAGFKAIYARGVLGPPLRLEVDDGKEFKGVVKKFFESKHTMIRVGRPGRHRQQSMVENLNRILGVAIFKRQTAQELITGEPSREWVSDLPLFVAAINKKLIRTPPAPIPANAEMTDGDDILPEGTLVRVRLDRPVNAQDKKLHGGFRAHDIKWEIAPRKISQILFSPGEPIRYLVEGIPMTSFTRAELQPVDATDVPPPATVLRGKAAATRPR